MIRSSRFLWIFDQGVEEQGESDQYAKCCQVIPDGGCVDVQLQVRPGDAIPDGIQDFELFA